MNGEAASAYDHVAIHAAQGEAIGAPVKFFPWFYPPTMLMFIAPLALMHYFVALRDLVRGAARFSHDRHQALCRTCLGGCGSSSFSRAPRILS